MLAPSWREGKDFAKTDGMLVKWHSIKIRRAVTPRRSGYENFCLTLSKFL
jgi:hypothetical protein